MYFQLATPPRARFYVMMVVSMVRPQQFHNASEIMIPRRLCQASTGDCARWSDPPGATGQRREGLYHGMAHLLDRPSITARSGWDLTAVDRKGRLYGLGEDRSHEKPKMDAPELKFDVRDPAHLKL